MSDTKKHPVDQLPNTAFNSVIDASRSYANNLSIRELVKPIPFIGSALDTLFAGEGIRYEKQRVEAFLADLRLRLEAVEQELGTRNLLASEELYDLIKQVLRHVADTRSEEKRRRFATIIENQCRNKSTWDKVENAVWLTNQLTDLQVEILNTITNNAPENFEEEPEKMPAGIFYNDKIVTDVYVNLTEIFRDIPPDSLAMNCNHLVTNGLLRELPTHDPHITGIPQYFKSTDSSKRFLKWVTSSYR